MSIRNRHDFYEPRSENGYIQLRSTGFFVDAQTFLKMQIDQEERIKKLEEERIKAEKDGEDSEDDGGSSLLSRTRHSGSSKSSAKVSSSKVTDLLENVKRSKSGAFSDEGSEVDPNLSNQMDLLEDALDDFPPEVEPLPDPMLMKFESDYRTALSKFIDKTMSDLPEYCQYTNKVRVFAQENVLNACQNVQYDSEKADRFKPILRDIAVNNGFRTIDKPDDHLFEALDRLKPRFPNFSEVIDHFISEFHAWSVLPVERWTVFPVLLNGAAGVGKTAFAKALAKILGVPYYFQNLGGTSAGFILNGSSAQWGSSKEGLLVKSFAQSYCANPLFLIDEIDKNEKGNRYPVEPVLLELLEPETSSSMTDEYANLKYNAAHGIYIATCNDLSAISKPLLSRFEVFTIASPEKRQRVEIARNMAKSIYPELEFDEDALIYLARVDINLRAMSRLIRKVVAAYAVHQKADKYLRDSQGSMNSQNLISSVGEPKRDSNTESNSKTNRVTIFHAQSAVRKSKYSTFKLLEWGD